MTAILNLAVIARDAMPDGGTLTFETRTAVSQQRCLGSEEGIAAANDVMIAVNATGHGVSVVHSDRSVADLGMIEDFIRQSDGHIDVRNEGGRGMSVSMYLPRTTGLVQPLAESPSEGGDETILIVEDDALVRRYVVTQVQSLGYRTLDAGNATEALTIIDSGGEIDLLFTDVMMPGSIGGRQFGHRSFESQAFAQGIVYVGYEKNAMVQDGRLGSGVLLLAKPYGKLELAEMIRTALGA